MQLLLGTFAALRASVEDTCLLAHTVARLTYALSDPNSAGLFFRIGVMPPGRSDWAKAVQNASVNWERVIGAALLENAITVLNDRISKLPPASVPEAVRDRIGRLALVWNFKLRMLETRLMESVGILEAAGIDVTLMKGAALALTVYRAFSDRPMADLDLLVHPRVAQESHRILQTAGWTLASIPRPADSWRDHHHLPPLVDTAGSGLRLELHTEPLVTGSPFDVTRSDMVATGRWIARNGVRVRVPDPHLHAAHAAIHFAYSHRMTSGGVNVFRDLVALRESGTLTWDGFLQAAVRTRSESCCYWTLRLARALAGLSVPDVLLGSLSPRLGNRISAVLEEHFSQLVLRADHACPSVELRQRLWEFALQIKRPDTCASSMLEHAQPEMSKQVESSAFRRVGAHFRRAPKWSRYVASILGPVFEPSA